MRIAALIQKKKRGRDAVTATLCRCHDWGQYEPMREEGDICSCEAETKKLRLPTPHTPPISQLFPLWCFLTANALCLGAARVKAASGGRSQRAWQLAFKRGNGFATAAPGGHGSHEGLRVGVRRTVKYGIGGAFLHNLPQIHDQNMAAQKAHNSQIVRNEKIGWPELLLHLAQEVERLRLH
ncbi:hypothetical protein SDC9_89920 [bioreactor metagenome]|uniref:Uncharacterized protein n=1 Tax=bioreactor metagenome TaxID=1076179 RepID=A0A644ZR60_9ZZZZ